jgi:hypothetical protein
MAWAAGFAQCHEALEQVAGRWWYALLVSRTSYPSRDSAAGSVLKIAELLLCEQRGPRSKHC